VIRFKGEVKLTTSAQVSIEKKGDVHTLLMKQATREIGGEYTVRAMNSLGTAAASATLEVTGDDSSHLVIAN